MEGSFYFYNSLKKLLKMKKIFFIINLFLFYSTAYSQSTVSFINNDSMKFSYRFISPSILDKDYVPSQYIIRVKISGEQRNMVKDFKREYWIRLLNDKATDWAANLILYDLYRKDATILEGTNLKSRSDWVLQFKKDDITYWEKCLK